MAADVLDADGKSMETQPEVTWASSDEAIATVKDGEVTGVAEGKATITATVKTEDGKEIKGEYEITVDATAPKLDASKSEVTDYKTLTVAFTEAVTGTPAVEVYKNGSRTKLDGITAALATDGKSVVVTSDKALAGDSKYEVKVSDVTDAAKNPIAKDSSVFLTKDKSQAEKFVASTPEVPVPDAKAQNDVAVYYSVIDQYGESLPGLAVGNLTVSAEIKGGYPLEVTAPVNNVAGNSYVTIKYAGAIVEGKTLTLTFKNKVNDTLTYTSSFDVTVVKRENVGVATAVKTLAVEKDNDAVPNRGTSTAAEFVMNSTKENNKFRLSVSLQDKYGYPLTSDSAKVTYTTSNDKVALFSNGKSFITCSATEKPVVSIAGVGETTIRAYLENNADVSVTATVKVINAELTNLEIEDNTLGTEYNGIAGYYRLVYSPNTGDSEKTDITGTTLSDLKYVVTKGADLADVEFVVGDGNKTTTKTIKDKPYLKVTPKANGKNDNEIEVTVYTKGTYDETTKQFSKGTIRFTKKITPIVDTKVASIAITPFEDKQVTVTDTATTNVVFKNAAGEDITTLVDPSKVDLKSGIEDVLETSKISFSVVNKKGVLSVTPKDEGTVTIAVNAGVKNSTTTFTVYKKAVISDAKFTASKAQPINNDVLYIAGDTSRVNVDGKYVIPVGVTFYNQYGKVMNVTAEKVKAAPANANDNECVAVRTANAYGTKYVALKKNSDGTYAKAGDADNVAAFGFYAEFTEDGSASAKANLANGAVYTFDNNLATNNTSYKKFSGEVVVSAKEQRTLSTFKLSDNSEQGSVNMTKNSSKYFGYTALDQYGQKIAIDTDLIKIKYAGADTDKANLALKGKSAYGFTVTLTGGSGTESAYVYYDANGNGTFDTATEKNITVYAYVKSANDITSVEVNNTVSASGYANYDAAAKAAYINAGDYTFDVTAKIGNDVVTVDPSELTFTVKSKDLKAAGSKDASDINASFNGNVLKFTGSDANVTGTVNVYATAANGVSSAEKTFHFSNVAPTAQNGTYFVSNKASNANNAAVNNKVTAITYGANANEKLYAYAVSQYGAVIDGIQIEKVTSYNTDNVTAEPDSETAGIVNITTKPGKAGTTTRVVIIITNPDKSRTTLNVDVTIK